MAQIMVIKIKKERNCRLNKGTWTILVIVLVNVAIENNQMK